MYYYLNDDKTYFPCTIEEWAEQLEDLHINDKKHIAEDRLNGLYVSTIWLGMDHGLLFDSDLNAYPLVFETMVFVDGHWGELDMQRYSTYNDAIEGHKRLVDNVYNGKYNQKGEQ